MNSVLQGTPDSTLKTLLGERKKSFSCIFLKKKIKENHFVHTFEKKSTKTLVHMFILKFVHIFESFLKILCTYTFKKKIIEKSF